jgi:Protein of unknown function (DUF2934)
MSHHHKHASHMDASPGKPTSQSNAAIVSSDNDHNGKLAFLEDIRLCAFQKWEAAGKPSGDGVPFWLEAEQELVLKKETASAHDHSQDADRHGKIRHPHSLK